MSILMALKTQKCHFLVTGGSNKQLSAIKNKEVNSTSTKGIRKGSGS